MNFGTHPEHGDIVRRSGPRHMGCEWIEYADGYQRPVAHYPASYGNLPQGVWRCDCGMTECTGWTGNQHRGTNPFE